MTIRVTVIMKITSITFYMQFHQQSKENLLMKISQNPYQALVISIGTIFRWLDDTKIYIMIDITVDIYISIVIKIDVATFDKTMYTLIDISQQIPK